MSEAKRYTVSRCGLYVVDYEEAAVCEDAARIARLLNAEEAVRAALWDAMATFAAMDATDDMEDQDRAAMSKVRAALSALDAEAVRP